MKTILETGNKFKRLGENINKQLLAFFKKNGFDSELKWWNILMLIFEMDSVSVQQIAKENNLSHPAVVQIINQLRSKKLIVTSKNNSDKRITTVTLTDVGRKKVEEMIPLINSCSTVLNKMFEKTGYDMIDIVSKLEKTLFENRFAKNLIAAEKETQMKKVEIVTYSKKYKKHFKDLNIEWLKKYFEVETYDRKLLSSPEEDILKKGGQIFFALLNNKVVGTCAMIKLIGSAFELTKMAVTESAQGKQIGKKLALTAIGFAISEKADKIVLDTNEKLSSAINLYRTLGFIVVPHQYDEQYRRKLIRMELKLNYMKEN